MLGQAAFADKRSVAGRRLPRGHIATRRYFGDLTRTVGDCIICRERKGTGSTRPVTGDAVGKNNRCDIVAERWCGVLLCGFLTGGKSRYEDEEQYAHKVSLH